MATISDILIAKGQAQAASTRGRGNIYADLISNLSSIPGQVIQQRRADDRANLQNEALQGQIAGQQQERDLRGQQMARQQQADADTRGLQEIEAAVFDAEGNFDVAKAEALAAERGMPHVIPKLREDAAKWNETGLEARKRRMELDAYVQEHAAADATSIAQNGYDLGTVQAWVTKRTADGFWSKEEGAKKLAQAADDPKSVIDPYVARAKPKLQEFDPTKEIRDESGKLIRPASAKLPEPITPYQQKQIEFEQRRLAETERKNRADESAKAGDKTELTPEGLDAAALMFAKTGQLPALGMGDKTTRKAIINRAAALTPGLDVASAKADFGANQKSLSTITGTLDTLTSFEKTAGKNLDQFLALADKIPDTGVPWLNMPVRLVTDKMAGSENQAAANAARDVALREIARVTNDPKLSGVLSDAARHEVASLSGKDATFAQIKAVAKVLKQDMANVHQSLGEQRDAIQGRIKASGQTAAPVVEEWVRDPKTGLLVKKGG